MKAVIAAVLLVAATYVSAQLTTPPPAPKLDVFVGEFNFTFDSTANQMEGHGRWNYTVSQADKNGTFVFLIDGVSLPVNGTLDQLNHYAGENGGFFGSGDIRPAGASEEGNFFYAGYNTSYIVAQVSYEDDYFTFSAYGSLHLVQ